ncbi:MAG: tetratricopeptide repeat protein [Myxococcaceae bacterium]
MSSLRRTFVLGILCLAATAAAAPPPPTPEVMKKLREIESAAWRGKADDLRMQFQEVVKSTPNDLLPRLYVAWCSMPTDTAWNQLKGLTTVAPNFTWAHLGMGRIYLGWKLKEQAENDFKAALKTDPKFYPALVGLGEVARAAGKAQDAEGRFREALAINDDAEAHAGLGLSLLEQNRAKEAKPELQRAVELWPDQPKVLQALSTIAKDEKDVASAAKYATLMLELTPKDKDVRKQLAEYKVQLKDDKGAAEQYETYVRLSGGDADVFRRLSELYAKLGNAEGEQRALEQLAAMDHDSPEAPLRLAEVAQRKNDFEGAETQLLEATARAPKRADVKLALARLRAKNYHLKDAIESYRAASEAPENQSPEIAKERAALEHEIGADRPVKGSVEQVNKIVSGNLNKFYLERLQEHPELEGMIRAKVRISAEGKANSVEIVEDSIGDPLLNAHVYFALKDADYEKKKRDPIFEFALKPPKGKKP